jgi:hypothetical protein
MHFNGHWRTFVRKMIVWLYTMCMILPLPLGQLWELVCIPTSLSSNIVCSYYILPKFLHAALVERSIGWFSCCGRSGAPRFIKYSD